MKNSSIKVNGGATVNPLTLTYMSCNGVEFENMRDMVTSLYYKKQGSYYATIKEFRDVRLYISRCDGIIELHMLLNGVDGSYQCWRWDRSRISDFLVGDIMWYIRRFVEDTCTPMLVSEVMDAIDNAVDADPYFDSYMDVMKEEQGDDFDYAYELGNYIVSSFEGYDDIVSTCVDEWLKVNGNIDRLTNVAV